LIDLYAIVSIFVLIVLGTWHSIIGTLIFLDDQYKDLSPHSRWTRLDRYAFIVLVSLYVLVHLGMGVWHYCVPIAQRRRMEEADRRYRLLVEENLSRKLSLN
jgi:signal transduction histidine kinase